MYDFLNFRGEQNAPKWDDKPEEEKRSYDGPANMQPDGEIEVGGSVLLSSFLA